MRRLLTLASLTALVIVAAGLGLHRNEPAALGASLGQATFQATTPGGSTPVNSSVNVPIDLTSFTPGDSLTWGGYDLEVDYTAGVVLATVSTEGPSNPCGVFWANVEQSPRSVSGCAFQNSTLAGFTLETITFTCLTDGVSPITIIPRPGFEGSGSALFDTSGIDFDMTLVGGALTCGTGGPTATPTFTPTPTDTATPTNTPTATSTAPTSTPTATATPGGPSTICTTNVGGPPTLGIGLDCDIDVNFGGVLGDGCVDTEDANPNDPWDFYTVPVPPLISAPFPATDFRNNAVQPSDAQAVFAYFVAGSAAGLPSYEQDLNGNGIKDGWEYDRSEDTSGIPGPPDGIVTARDAQVAFGQFAAGNACSSGYDLSETRCTTNVGGPPTLGTGRDCDQAAGFPGVLGDGCVDSEDVNAADPWDFFSVPLPVLFASPGGLRDNAVTVADAQAVFAYFKRGAHAGTALYDQDMNHNLVPDGWEYDRSVLGPGILGAPNGFITAQDAQAAFLQFKANRHCSSGYNMKNHAP